MIPHPSTCHFQKNVIPKIKCHPQKITCHSRASGNLLTSHYCEIPACAAIRRLGMTLRTRDFRLHGGPASRNGWKGGMSIRESTARSLELPYRRLPASDSARIHVHKVRFLIVANTTAAHSKRGVTQIVAGNVSEAYVDCLAEQVLAFLRNPAAGIT
jgi:hypothetical protein